MNRLIMENLATWTTAPNGIKKLHELILELAVRGLLVPQDPNDEPASVLLEKIAVEKANPPAPFGKGGRGGFGKVKSRLFCRRVGNGQGLVI